jgi:hypothetical protein
MHEGSESGPFVPDTAVAKAEFRPLPEDAAPQVFFSHRDSARAMDGDEQKASHVEEREAQSPEAVSYTHLTLPTKA